MKPVAEGLMIDRLLSNQKIVGALHCVNAKIKLKCYFSGIKNIFVIIVFI